jgi:hypothetical protein
LSAFACEGDAFLNVPQSRQPSTLLQDHELALAPAAKAVRLSYDHQADEVQRESRCVEIEAILSDLASTVAVQKSGWRGAAAGERCEQRCHFPVCCTLHQNDVIVALAWAGGDRAIRRARQRLRFVTHPSRQVIVTRHFLKAVLDHLDRAEQAALHATAIIVRSIPLSTRQQKRCPQHLRIL